MTAHTVRIKHAKLPPGAYSVQWLKALPICASLVPYVCYTVLHLNQMSTVDAMLSSPGDLVW